MKKKDYEKALEDFKVATENFESNEKNKADQKYYLMGRGYCQHKLGKLDEALATYEEVLQLEDAKGWHIALTNRGNVKLDKEDKEGAMEDFKAALEKKDDYAPALNGRGKVKFLNDDIDGAMEDFEEAIAKDANHAPAYNNRALVKYKRGEYEDALKDADAAVAKGGDDFAEAFLNRGTIQEMLFKADEACNDWTKAKELGEEKAAGYLESSGCATEEK